MMMESLRNNAVTRDLQSTNFPGIWRKVSSRKSQVCCCWFCDRLRPREHSWVPSCSDILLNCASGHSDNFSSGLSWEPPDTGKNSVFWPSTETLTGVEMLWWVRVHFLGWTSDLGWGFPDQKRILNSCQWSKRLVSEQPVKLSLWLIERER